MGLASGSISVLCVDDEPGLAELTATFLERADEAFSTATAESAQEALVYLEANDVDCVVSDYDMPRTDGLELLESVRATDPELPFILFTEHGSEEIASDATSAGASDYMEKRSGNDHYEVLAQRIRNAVDEYRSRAEKREIETRARTVFEASPDAITVSVDGAFVYANAAACDLYGVSEASDLLGHPVGDFIDPEHREDVGGQLRAVEAGDRLVEGIPRTVLTRDGEEIAVTITARHVTWNGDPGVVAIVRERSRNEGVRRETRYEAAFESAFDAMVVADEDGRYIDANASACELFGLPKEDLLGRSIAEFIPEGCDFEAVWGEFEAVGTHKGTIPIVREGGETRTIEYAATADIVDGEHLSVLRDVTEKGDRERVLREMYEIISNREQPFEEQTNALLELGRAELGVAYGTLSRIRGEEYVFEVVSDDNGQLRSDDVVPLSETNCEVAAETERTLVFGDIERDAPEMTERAGYTEWGISCYLGAPVFTDNGLYGTLCFYDTEPRAEQFTEWEVTLVDLMSRWVGYELQRQRSNLRLREQNEKLQRFASIVSHDLRNPLNVLEGSLELAEESGDPADFERCRRSVERMHTLIEDLLSLARAGTMIDETEAVRLASSVEECWKGVEATEATLETAFETEAVIEADRSRLKQLFENLFRNAVEHAGEDSTVTVGALAEGFYVEDDGPGIPEEDRADVFEGGYSTLEDGTGFGLAIVEEIVDAHGWTIRLGESDSGGARFEITGVDSGQ